VLNRLSRRNKVTIDWIPGHSGIPGNEEADQLAREATLIPRDGIPRAVGWSYSLLKYKLSERLSKLHQQSWDDRVDCKQTKMFVAGPSKKTAQFLLSLKRSNLRTLIGIVTGHSALNYHMSRLNVLNSPTCPKCLEEDETAEHFVCRCPIYSRPRMDIWGAYELQTSELVSLDIKTILTFVRKTGRVRGPEGT
jgi:hypothetical protein